jgi:hypothetical protein
MSDETNTYPSDAGAATFLLTVRGKLVPDSVEEARKIHNDTAGNPAGVAAARSLGDLSHNVYVGQGDAHPGELLFIDFWNSLSGLGRFFSDPQVKVGAGLMFSSMDNPVWVEATDFGAYHLTTPSGRTPDGLGIIRSRVTSLEAAAEAFRAYSGATINRARRHGHVSHSLWIKAPEPGTPAEPEILGIDVWHDADEMARYYDLSLGFELLGPVFAGAPDSSVWRAAPGEWVEW